MANRKIYYRKFSDNIHTTIKELIEHPPKGYEFIVSENQEVSINKLSGMKKSSVIKWLYNLFLKKLINPYKLMSLIYRFKKIPECDFIYTYGDLVYQKKNWVVELDSIWDFVGNQEREIKNKKKIEGILSSKYCKKIMPWNSYSKRTIEKELDISGFRNKIEVVHIAADVPFRKRKKHGKKIKILFVGTSNQINDLAVFSKGIREVFEAFEILCKKYNNLELVVVSQIPSSLKEHVKNPHIRVIGTIPREKVFEIYNDCDIFVYPAYFSQSLVIVEAMGSWLPLVTTDMMVYDDDNMVDDGKNGFLIRIPNKESYRHPNTADFADYIKNFNEKNSVIMVSGIVRYVSKFIENKKLREKMGRSSRKKYLMGYSIEARNKKLKRIFDQIKD